MSQWTIFSNHGHVLLFLARNPEARLRDVAAEVGITERAVQKIVRDLQDGGLLGITKQGRCNRYRIQTRKPLRHRLESHRTVGSLVRLIAEGDSAAPSRQAAGADPAKDEAVRDAPARASRDRTTQPGRVKSGQPEAVTGKKGPQESIPAGGDRPPWVDEHAEPPPKPSPAARPAAPAAETPGSERASPTAQKPRKTRRKKSPADDQQGSLF